MDPTIGTRIRLANHLGTVRFVGNVLNTTETWIGIEWDDPHRGKHDGVKDGQRYFTCRAQNSGSFIRPSSKISYGQSFLEALSSRYIEAPHGSGSQEKVVLGSSNGAIVVEAVRLDKIRGKLANLAGLREVSLNNHDVARCDAVGTIRATCPSVCGLDLSMNLLPSWDVVATITRELPALQRLCLNRNRLQSAANFAVMDLAFLHLTEVQLNGTMLTWQEMQTVTSTMPSLEVIEMGYNCLTSLHSGEENPPQNKTVQVINLDSNACSDWAHVCKSISHYTSLQRLVLTSNFINAIPFWAPQQGLLNLKHISLSYNKIHAWSDVDALSSWCPCLETLTLSGNPVTSQEHSRPFTISKIPTLLILDGALISQRERSDSEILYLSHVIQEPGSEGDRIQAHPQWLNLCTKYGRPENAVAGKVSQDKLSQRLIALNLYQCGSPTASDALQALKADPLILHVLPTMVLRTLRMKTCKVFKIKATILFWLRQADGALVELGSDCDLQGLDWLGLDDGASAIFHVAQSWYAI